MSRARVVKKQLKKWAAKEGVSLEHKGRHWWLSFKERLGWILRKQWELMSRRLEIDFMYGGRYAGIICAVDGPWVTISDASWAPAMWTGMEYTKLRIGESFHTLLSIDLEAHRLMLDPAPCSIYSGGAEICYAHNWDGLLEEAKQ